MSSKDKLVLSLCEKLYICSRLLTRAAERLNWDTEKVQSLISELKESIKGDCDAYIKKNDNYKE